MLPIAAIQETELSKMGLFNLVTQLTEAWSFPQWAIKRFRPIKMLRRLLNKRENITCRPQAVISPPWIVALCHITQLAPWPDPLNRARSTLIRPRTPPISSNSSPTMDINQSLRSSTLTNSVIGRILMMGNITRTLDPLDRTVTRLWLPWIEMGTLISPRSSN